MASHTPEAWRREKLRRHRRKLFWQRAILIFVVVIIALLLMSLHNPAPVEEVKGDEPSAAIEYPIMEPPVIDLKIAQGELYNAEHLDKWDGIIQHVYTSGEYEFEQDYLVRCEDIRGMVMDCRALISYECWPGETLVQALAKVVTAEIGGLTDSTAYSTARMEEAAVVWCVLNRVDSSYEYASAEEVISILKAPYQYAYSSNGKIHSGMEEICTDVLIRWQLEKHGLIENVGRVLPADYMFFSGDGRHNRYRRTYRSTSYWNWDFKDPYVKEG